MYLYGLFSKKAQIFFTKNFLEKFIKSKIWFNFFLTYGKFQEIFMNLLERQHNLLEKVISRAPSEKITFHALHFVKKYHISKYYISNFFFLGMKFWKKSDFRIFFLNITLRKKSHFDKILIWAKIPYQRACKRPRREDLHVLFE